MKKIIILVVTILCVIMMGFSVFAHPGSLDEYGWHYDHSTGEYHYHHGYSAHSHEGGTCPYDFNDQTDRTNHGSSSSSKTYDDDDFTYPEDETRITGVYRAAEEEKDKVDIEKTENENKKNAKRKKQKTAFICIIAVAAYLFVFFIAPNIFFRSIEHPNKTKKTKKDNNTI